MKQALLIPIYQPSDKVLPFLKQFKKEDFDLFLVVDDGSGEEYQSIFAAISNETVFTVLSYPLNHGKGHALKTGMHHLLKNHPDLDSITTADGDGQHTYHDILHLKEEQKKNQEALMMGVRDFSGPTVPRRSKIGNGFSSWYFKVATGVRLNDTQTGLRSIPYNLFDLALQTPGERFDYEMKFLLEAVKEAEMVQVTIQTVYEEENHVSHFRTIRDSVLIYKTPLFYLLVSVASWLLDIGIFSLLSNFVFTGSAAYQIYLSTIAARIFSGVFNFIMFAYVVFPSKNKKYKMGVKYFVLFVVNMLLSASLTYAFSYLSTALTFIKVIVDLVIAIANYFINLTWVFATKKRKQKKEKGGDETCLNI